MFELRVRAASCGLRVACNFVQACQAELFSQPGGWENMVEAGFEKGLIGNG